MASGVKVSDECKRIFTEMKLGRKHRFVIYRLDKEMKQIEVQETAEPVCNYNDLVAKLLDAAGGGDCRYAVFDAEFEKNGQKCTKIVFLAWMPDEAKIKQRMVYASSKDALKRALGEGLGVEVQANDAGDLDWNQIMEKINRTDRH